MVDINFIKQNATASGDCGMDNTYWYYFENTIYVDGEEHMLDVPAEIVDNRTMIPLRAVNEGLGMMVTYISEVQTIIIES